jgi:hypothetical protein
VVCLELMDRVGVSLLSPILRMVAPRYNFKKVVTSRDAAIVRHLKIPLGYLNSRVLVFSKLIGTF